MTEYDNRNSFILSKNDRKQTDKQPDYTGLLTDENGNEFELAAWVRVRQKDGRKFFSGKLKPKEARRDSGPVSGGFGDPGRRGSMKDQLNDEIPF